MADSHSKSITTNDKGEFEFTATQNEYEMMVDDVKWVADMIDLHALVQKSAENDIEIRLREGKRVAFQLTAGADYEPLANHEIQISGNHFHRTIHTDAKGFAATTLDRGLYTIYPAINENLARQNIARSGLSEIRVLVKDQAELTVPIHLDRNKPRSVLVTVLKSDGATPVENAKVAILNPYTDVAVADRFRPSAASRLGGGGRAAPDAARGAFDGGEGFAPGGLGGTGLRPDGSVVTREVTLESVQTDSAGKTKVLVAYDAPAIIMVSGPDGEKAIAKVDILEDASTIRLAKTVSVKGRLLDDATGAPIAGHEIAAQMDSGELIAEARRSTRGAAGASSAFRTTAVTNAEGRFEFKDLIADTAYLIQSSPPRSGLGGPGGAPPTEIRSLVSQLSVRNFQTTKEGDKDLGEIKAKVVTPRGARPRDPNVQ